MRMLLLMRITPLLLKLNQLFWRSLYQQILQVLRKTVLNRLRIPLQKQLHQQQSRAQQLVTQLMGPTCGEFGEE
jgi:hypothetical protein